MAERMPLRVPVAIDAFVDALVAFRPMEVVMLLRLVRWMTVNASPLPADLNEICVIALARSTEARNAIVELTGLQPVPPGQICPPGTALSPRDVPPGQGLAFTHKPGVGLTLSVDRAWGIEPLEAESDAERVRRVEREHKQRQRARKAERLSRGDKVEAVPGGLVRARNSVVGIQALSLPSVESVPRAHVHEAEADPLAAGKLRGAKLAVLRRTGVTGCNGGDPRFVALCAAGVTDDELTWAGDKAVARGAGFPYAVETLLRARLELAAGTPPSMPAGLPTPSRPMTSYEAECAAWAGPSAVGYKPPS